MVKEIKTSNAEKCRGQVGGGEKDKQAEESWLDTLYFIARERMKIGPLERSGALQFGTINAQLIQKQAFP